jgi:hypothetical protein
MPIDIVTMAAPQTRTWVIESRGGGGAEGAEAGGADGVVIGRLYLRRLRPAWHAAHRLRTFPDETHAVAPGAVGPAT